LSKSSQQEKSSNLRIQVWRRDNALLPRFPTSPPSYTCPLYDLLNPGTFHEGDRCVRLAEQMHNNHLPEVELSYSGVGKMHSKHLTAGAILQQRERSPRRAPGCDLHQSRRDALAPYNASYNARALQCDLHVVTYNARAPQQTLLIAVCASNNMCWFGSSVG